MCNVKCSKVSITVSKTNLPAITSAMWNSVCECSIVVSMTRNSGMDDERKSESR